MTKGKILNYCFGFSFIYWAIAGFTLDFDGIKTPLIRVAISILNLTVAALILIRKPIQKEGSLYSVISAVPSLICGGLLFKLTIPFNEWSLFSEVLFLTGTGIALLSFLFLGSNFSIFPTLRNVVTGGFYKIIRHPSYFGEILMCLACLVSTTSPYAISLFVVLIPFIIWRILEEEKLLKQSFSYIAYTKHVKWRLFPGVW